MSKIGAKQKIAKSRSRPPDRAKQPPVLIDIVDPLNLFIVALSFVAIWLFFGFLDRNPQNWSMLKSKPSLSGKAVQASYSTTLPSPRPNRPSWVDPDLIAINHHIKAVIIQSEYQKSLLENKNYLERSDRSNRFDSSTSPLPGPNDYSPSRAPNPLSAFLNDHKDILVKPPDTNQTPEDIVNQMIAKDEWARQYQEAHEKAYIDNFLENAKEDGMDILLDTEYNIVDIQRIPESRRKKIYHPSR